MNFKGTGYVALDYRKDWFGVIVKHDLGRYYLWLLKRWVSLGFRGKVYDPSPDGEYLGKDPWDSVLFQPAGGWHITMCGKLGNVPKKRFDCFVGKTVNFNYNVKAITGGHSSNFWNFTLPVWSDDIRGIQDAIGIKRINLHITIANTKHAHFNRKFSLPRG